VIYKNQLFNLFSFIQLKTNLREISNKVASNVVIYRQHIEVERLHIIVQGLVVKEEFGEQTEVLAVDLGPVTIHLEH